MKLKGKFILYFLAVGLIPFLFIAAISYYIASQALESDAENLLTSISESRYKQITAYFENKIQETETLSRLPSVKLALKKYYQDVKYGKYQQVNNPELYKLFDRILRDDLQIKTYGFYDIFLIDKEGNIIYTEAKEVDYATNLINGEYKDTNLAQVFNAAKKQVSFKDFQWYAPSNEPASFIASPILDSNDKFLGVLATQVPLNQVNAIMQDNIGLGETGESYLVGSNYLLRSDSRLDKNLTVTNSFAKNIKIATESVKQALSGKSGHDIIKDYRDIDVLSSYKPLNIMGIKWALITEIDKNEAFKAITDFTLLMSILSALLLISIITAGYIISNSIVNPIKYIATHIQSFARGDFSQEIKTAKGKDEIADLTRAANKLKEDLKALISNIVNKMENVAASSEELQAISKSSTEVTTQVTETIEQMAVGYQDQTENVANSSMQVAEMAQIASDSAKNIAEGQSDVELALTKIFEIKNITENLSDQICTVGSLAQEIGKIVKLITNIASQTNLLALNAAIESARAGEHGKGFAVVAEEVKKLADESAEAADQIKGMIEQIQNASIKAVKETKVGVDRVDEGVSAVNKVQEVFITINQYSEDSENKTIEISTAMENISAVTEEAAASAEEIVSSMQEQNAGMEELSHSASLLAELTNELNLEMSKFKL